MSFVHSTLLHPLPTHMRNANHQVKVPGVDEGMNDAFLDQMEAYFGQPEEDKAADVRPHFSYQVRSPFRIILS